MALFHQPLTVNQSPFAPSPPSASLAELLVATPQPSASLAAIEVVWRLMGMGKPSHPDVAVLVERHAEALYRNDHRAFEKEFTLLSRHLFTTIRLPDGRPLESIRSTGFPSHECDHWTRVIGMIKTLDQALWLREKKVKEAADAAAATEKQKADRTARYALAAVKAAEVEEAALIAEAVRRLDATAKASAAMRAAAEREARILQIMNELSGTPTAIRID